MKIHSRAFTLIELLVVIAIIAILAAILFPVFAQAKAAAKKTADLSGMKQTGTSAAIYLADSDDTFPIAVGSYPGIGPLTGYLVPAPADWDPSDDADPDYGNAARSSWANSMQPYMKSYDVLSSAVAKVLPWPGVNYAGARKKPSEINFTYNGLLSGYSATAVAAPSQLIAFSQSDGTMATKGYLPTNPTLQCSDASPACKFVRVASSNCFNTDGAWGYAVALRYKFNNEGQTNWVHTGGMNASFADTSAKWRRVGANVNGLTDYRTDPYAQYNRQGVSQSSWYDGNYCHPILFSPDFDFQNFAQYGNPIAGQ